ncbi:PPOX class F420-dependent oxidoreductase [Nocardia terpenica]|uniref:PPOX class F420-dependent enzyme n=1 Tax=Nocardia terpenica TaxID=455432 RepID=A0A164LWR5_9NOCA|nr:PPOX class F420-dependent oxidoreductase [Nocardia terpenica]KZM72821.1 PPOX class F420-dependent enzyme [Nocardia terpenica]MBF6061272.1 PPOX class F420-dependent oxidoreductase [Nocardia terpenica]MBF6105499.1 PPOX class F420-dependent oxidoreductase [Nocardia terpenica]MBF6113031.1 PPOX class F420-dependent oxidoreductase [Nocardia terpenica]MBF6119161.1 PPOX class F420-dependent oxidoreductase [Nocardia terpenica]
MNSFTDLGDGKYVYLTYLRKNGTPVGFPIWVARDGDRLVVWVENVDTGKVKAMRRNPGVTVAACDLRGNRRGAQIAATARILDTDETNHVRALIARKYRLPGYLAIYGNRLLRGKDTSVGIALTRADAVTTLEQE